MAIIDIIIPTYRGLSTEANQPLIAMLQATNCQCRDPRTGTPLHAPWECTKGKHSVRFLPQQYNSSVVHWARNQAVAQALYQKPIDARPPAEYYLMIDDDMVAEPGYLSRLVSYKKDIVCGICTIKRDPPRPNIRFWHPEEASFRDPVKWDWDSQHLIEIDAAGAAFMLVKRGVFEKMAEAHLNCDMERAEDSRKLGMRLADENCPQKQINRYWAKKSEIRRARFDAAIAAGDWKSADCWWFDFQKNIVDNQIGECGEDISFCWKAKKLGFKIYADPQVLPGHLGMYSYSIRDYRQFVEAAEEDGEMPQLRENRASLEPAEV
jgi:hypothetical protein